MTAPAHGAPSNAMKDRAMGFGRKLGRDFMAFTPGQKAVSIFGALAVIIGGYLFSTWASTPTYAPLYTNLAPTDASAIVDKLNAAHKPYKLSSAGTEILVPQSDVYAERLTMSAAGLPNSGQTGYSLLDKEGITTSEFVQHVDYQRAIEGELANTITAISGIQAAQIHLALPDSQSVFNDNTTKPTAAVLLTTTPGTTLTSNQVRSIVNLVSSSVPGLAADQVTVADSNGTVLSLAGTGITGGGGSSTQTEQTTSYDSRLAASVQSMLDRVLGPGHSVIAVNAQLNFDSDSKTTNSYVYQSGVPPVAISSSSENYTGNGAASGGVLGAGTPTPTPTATGTSTSASGDYNKTSVVQNNAVGTVQQTTIAAPGSVQKLGVSVVLDKTAAGAIDEATVQKLVSSAVGLDTTRGDSLAIATLPFDTSTAQEAAAAAKASKTAAASAASKAQLMSMIKTGGVVLAIAIIVIIAVIGRKRRGKPEAPPDELDTFLLTLNDGDPADVPKEPAMRIVPNGAMDTAEAQATRQAVTDLAGEQPDDVARALRNWMNTKGS
jgi:flagellar M-ring protein FliF